MLNLTPKEIDELFRRGAEQYDFEYNPVAWAQMEQLLDKEKRKRFVFWWFWGILIGISSLLVVWSVYLFANKMLFSNLIKENSAQVKLPIETAIDSCLSLDITTILPYPSKNSEVSISEKQLVNLEPKSDHTQDNIKKKSIIEEQNIEQQVSNLDIFSQALDSTNTTISIPTSDSIFRLAAVDLLTTVPLAFPSTARIVPDSFVPSPFPTTPLEPLKENGVFLFGLQTSAELTGAGNWNNFSDWGWKAGIAVEYLYKKKSSLSLGLLYSYKPYKASGDDYQPKDYYPRKKPESATGICDILEIPLEWGYYFKGFKEDGFFAKAGLSSYWMLREQYNFTYKYPDSTQVSDIAVYNENKHWLAIGQVSLGYQRHIGNNWNIQIVPYVQFPLSGVGEGNIKLYSIGTTFRGYFSKVKR